MDFEKYLKERKLFKQQCFEYLVLKDLINDLDEYDRKHYMKSLDNLVDRLALAQYLNNSIE